MDVSIDWPRGRGDTDEPLDQSADSYASDGTGQDCVLDDDGNDFDPYVLAPGRKRDWPHVAEHAAHPAPRPIPTRP